MVAFSLPSNLWLALLVPFYFPSNLSPHVSLYQHFDVLVSLSSSLVTTHNQDFVSLPFGSPIEETAALHHQSLEDHPWSG